MNINNYHRKRKHGGKRPKRRHVYPTPPDYLIDHHTIQHGRDRLLKATLLINAVTIFEVTVSSKAAVLPEWFGRPSVMLPDEWMERVQQDLPRFFRELLAFRKAKAAHDTAKRLAGMRGGQCQ